MLVSDGVCRVTAIQNTANFCIRWAQAVDVDVDGAEETVNLLVLPSHALHHASYTPLQFNFCKDMPYV